MKGRVVLGGLASIAFLMWCSWTQVWADTCSYPKVEGQKGQDAGPWKALLESYPEISWGELKQGRCGSHLVVDINALELEAVLVVVPKFLDDGACLDPSEVERALDSEQGTWKQSWFVFPSDPVLLLSLGEKATLYSQEVPGCVRAWSAAQLELVDEQQARVGEMTLSKDLYRVLDSPDPIKLLIATRDKQHTSTTQFALEAAQGWMICSDCSRAFERTKTATWYIETEYAKLELATATFEESGTETESCGCERVPDRIREKDNSPMSFVPGGSFEMGLAGDQEEAQALVLCEAHGGKHCHKRKLTNEGPAVRVEIGDFYLDEEEITMGDYDQCVSDGGCKEIELDQCSVFTGAAWVAGHEIELDPELPARCVTRDEAQSYCRWAGARLPTEAEWERAARLARAEGLFGESEWADVVYASENELRTEPTSRTADEARFSNLLGNVYEWVDGPACAYEEWRDALSECEDRRGVLRGGAFLSDAVALRVTARRFTDPEIRSSANGFRCAADAEAEGLVQPDISMLASSPEE